MMYPKTQKVIHDYLEDKVMPGVSYAFIKADQIEKYTLGYAQIVPEQELLREEMLFDVASLTKVICTTTMVLKLIEEGKIGVDDSLQTHLPAFQDSQVTIRHLLTHTSAIDPFIKNRDQLDAQELRHAMLRLSSSKQRGQEVVYTDTGTVLLGFMLEEIAQTDLHTLFQKEILNPIGMTASTFKPKKELAVPTEIRGERGLIRGEVHDPKAFTLQADCGSAGLFASLDDCLIFSQMILNKGKLANGDIFLKATTIESLLMDQTPSGNLGRSLGWDLKRTEKDQRPLLFHTGYTGTFLLLDVERKHGFIFLSNRVHPIDYRKEYLQKRDYLVATYLKESAFNSGNLL